MTEPSLKDFYPPSEPSLPSIGKKQLDKTNSTATPPSVNQDVEPDEMIGSSKDSSKNESYVNRILCSRCQKAAKRSGIVTRGGGKSQRIACRQHGSTPFYSYFPDFVEENEKRKRQTINGHLYVGGSQKSRAAELGKSRQVIIRELRKLRDECPNDLEVIQLYEPDWGNDLPDGGILVIDATKLDGTPFFLYVGFDLRTRDPVCYTIARGENAAGWERFFQKLDRTGYKLRLLVSDLGFGNCLVNMIARRYPNIPHQADWLHPLRKIRKKMGWSAEKLFFLDASEQLLYHLLMKLRYASDENDFDETWTKILQLYASIGSEGRQVIDLLKKYHKHLKARYSVGVNITTTNVAEYGFSRLKQLFLIPRKGIHVRSESQVRKAANLLMWVYRTKPMDSSTDPSKRGRTTLELAKSKAKRNDVWQFMDRQQS